MFINLYNYISGNRWRPGTWRWQRKAWCAGKTKLIGKQVSKASFPVIAKTGFAMTGKEA